MCHKNFYPRSPCGERRKGLFHFFRHINFYPRSPCGERLILCFPFGTAIYFYPRSPCGERQDCNTHIDHLPIFLSTLSLRRATSKRFPPMCTIKHFYPRSPCGERPALPGWWTAGPAISIHALLAESDDKNECTSLAPKPFLSTLSLRRATRILHQPPSQNLDFYPRSPCGERPHYDNYNLHCVEISIHALLAESDRIILISVANGKNFYPRSPCGERRLRCINSMTHTQFLSTLSLRRATR